VLQQIFVEEQKKVGVAEANPLKLIKFMSPGFRKLLVADILVRFSEQIPYAFMAIWVINNHGISPVMFGVLTTIEW